ncbi:MAG: thiazole tautomerase TenI [Defluviitaleaceae bacterium]|nr:thiazole tautomerase TenI [Defluviitaleaceae bacterium]
MQLHLITDGEKTQRELVRILTAVHPYVDKIHLREKAKTARELADLVTQLLHQGIEPGKLMINDRVDVAHAFELGGVQLAFHSLDVARVRQAFPHLEIGCSIHSVEEAAQATKKGADFLLYGHVFPTQSKVGLPPRGTTELKAITTTCQLPVIAIGGITPKNKHQLVETHVAGLAVMRGILDATDPIQAVKNYRNIE